MKLVYFFNNEENMTKNVNGNLFQSDTLSGEHVGVSKNTSLFS